MIHGCMEKVVGRVEQIKQSRAYKRDLRQLTREYDTGGRDVNGVCSVTTRAHDI